MVLDHVLAFINQLLYISLSLSPEATLLTCSERVTVVTDVTFSAGAAMTPFLQIDVVGDFYC
jgi:hypothetical protein